MPFQCISATIGKTKTCLFACLLILLLLDLLILEIVGLLILYD